MKITVLGSGGFGYPLGFCDCEYCTQARKLGGKNIRKRASILINDEMLIDLTPDSQTAMTMYNKDMSKVKYLIQTHTHLDHFDTNIFTALDFKYGTKRNGELNLICSDLCLRDMQEKASRYDKLNLYDKSYLEKIKLKIHTINHGQTLHIGDYTIKAIYCEHDTRIGAQLYLITYKGKTLFYATDTPLIKDVSLNELKGAKINAVFLDESFGLNDFMFSHLNLAGFNEVLDELRADELLTQDCQCFATHLTHDGNPLHDELEKLLSRQQGCHAAWDGLELNL